MGLGLITCTLNLTWVPNLQLKAGLCLCCFDNHSEDLIPSSSSPISTTTTTTAAAHQCLSAKPTHSALKLHTPISSILLDFPLAQRGYNIPRFSLSFSHTHTHISSSTPSPPACQELGTVKLISSGNGKADSLMAAMGCNVNSPPTSLSRVLGQTDQSRAEETPPCGSRHK